MTMGAGPARGVRYARFQRALSLTCTPEACVPPSMRTMLQVGLMLLVSLCSCGTQNPHTQISSDAWREDLRYLARELPSRHANAFHSVSREAFDAEVARLDTTIPRLNGDEVLVGFMRVVALIGDGHTHFDLPPTTLRYPVEMQWFGDELRVIAAQAPYHSAVGARVIAIGSTPIRDVMERATNLSRAARMTGGRVSPPR